MTTFAVVGTSVPRVEGYDKVTGAARFSADQQVTGYLWAKILRSPVPHTRILKVDVTQARALAGVRAVITGADIGDLRLGNVVKDMPVLCTDRVRFVGDAVAAVAADDLDTAEAALDLIDFEYDPLPIVSDPEAALAGEGTPIHPDIKSYLGAPDLPDIPNLQGYSIVTKGNVEQAMASADHVFEHTFRTKLAHQGYLEQRTTLVQIQDDGTFHVWSSCKMPYKLRDFLAELLELPKEKVAVQRANIGGDFGAKGAIGAEPIICFLARVAGRPILYVPTYVEEFQAGNPRHPAIMRLRTGVNRDGKIVAREARVILDGGAYGAHKITPKVDIPSVTRALGPYKIDHTLIESRIAYTNGVPCGIARSPGQPQVVFAGESQIDLIAEALGMDPIDFRLKNVIADGDVWPAGERFDAVMARETLELARQASSWDAPLGPNRGRGIAITERGIPAAPSGVVTAVEADGAVTVTSAIPDVGTGAFTVLRQIIAEELCLPLDAVTIVSGDTNNAPLDAGIGGSKSTFSMTAAAIDATTEIKERVAQVIADDLESAVEDVEVSDLGYQVKGTPETAIPVREAFARAARRTGGRLLAQSPGPGARKATCSCSVATVVEVEVDPETGKVTPIKITAASDVGQAINPSLLQAQVDGAMIQGMGFALMEEMESEDCRISTVNLGDYKIPAIPDVPEFVSVLVEGAAGPAPYGAKAVGELANCPVAAATANAIARAAGARAYALPLTAERVREALIERDESTSGASSAH